MKNTDTEKLYHVYYGEGEQEYINRHLKDSDIIDGYLSEASAFKVFYSDMIMSNNYLSNNYDNLDVLISSYAGHDDYMDEYQTFIISPEFEDDITIKATNKMGNTLYYDFKNEIYLTGITDFGTSRTIVPTNIKVKEVK